MASRLFLVQLNTRGWVAIVSFSPEEHVLTTFFRLSKVQRASLQYLKVKFYRKLARLAVTKFADQYVVRERDLVEVEKTFREIYNDFLKIRKEIYNELVTAWPEIEARLKSFAEKLGYAVDVSRLKPTEESFLELSYSVMPLDLVIAHVFNLAEEFRKKAVEAEEYKALAGRIEAEAKQRIKELEERYNGKIKELEETVEKLKKALTEKEKQLYLARLGRLEEDAMDIAGLLGKDTVEALKAKIEAVHEALARL